MGNSQCCQSNCNQDHIDKRANQIEHNLVEFNSNPSDFFDEHYEAERNIFSDRKPNALISVDN